MNQKPNNVKVKRYILAVMVTFSLLIPMVIYSVAPPQQVTSAAQPIRENIAVKLFSKKLSELKGYQLIDVRSPEEFRTGHLKGAKVINFYSNDFDKQLLTLDKNKPVLVYCQSGVRSGKAASRMEVLGFKEVYNMNGGIKAWISAGYPVE